jgi:glycosyltransferase involved in cell wall biosynthesis
MLLSVFTPTHNPTHLGEVYQCLKAQVYGQWEWVVVPNGELAGAIAAYLTQLTEGDRRVRVCPAPPDVQGVGALKRYACDLCNGDVFVEVDHDDLVTDDCLLHVHDAVKYRATPLVFVYSEDVTMSFDHTSHVFDAAYGWRHYAWEYQGRKYTINGQPPASPRSLCEILYAPDHVRAWTRAAYQTAGRHDPGLAVGDDHDLVVRTYLAGAEFVHVKKPLYLHRLNPDTTSQKNLPQIERQSWATRDKYLHALVKEWCGRHRLPMFDLGGAHNSPPGYEPIDANLPMTAPFRGDVFDVVAGLKDDSVGCFRAQDFLEHVPIGQVVPLFNLLYRKLVPGGYLLTHTPAVCDDEGRCGRGAYQDPDHKSFWSSNNFWYFTDREFAKYENGAVECRFQTVRIANHYPSDFHRTHLIPYVLWDGMALKHDDANYFPGPKKI